MASAGVAEFGPDDLQRNDDALVAGELVEGGELGEAEEEVEEGAVVDTAEQIPPRESVRSRCVDRPDNHTRLWDLAFTVSCGAGRLRANNIHYGGRCSWPFTTVTQPQRP